MQAHALQAAVVVHAQAGVVRVAAQLVVDGRQLPEHGQVALLPERGEVHVRAAVLGLDADHDPADGQLAVPVIAFAAVRFGVTIYTMTISTSSFELSTAAGEFCTSFEVPWYTFVTSPNCFSRSEM